MGGFNLPDGVSEGTKTAPWNQPDPWVGKTCGECRHALPCHMVVGPATLVCACSVDFAVFEVRPSAKACEAFA